LSRVKYQFDEHIAGAVARALRRRGIDVLTSVEADLVGAPDFLQLAHAHADGRVMVTHDSDFLRFQDDPHAGIAYCKPQSRSIGELIETLLLIHDVMEAEELVGRVQYL
jgi:predicted nuclease of predicted toxin-antitoxin system